jgi:hypothetical protein
MLVGHIAVGMLGKRAEPRLSLGTTVLAALFADLLVDVFLVVGAESISPVSIPYSHSLAMGIVWAALFGAVYFWRRGFRRGAWILFALVLSHWLLDVVSHRPDMPLAPGVPLLLGLGLWNSMAASMVLEGGLWVAAIVLYLRSVRFKSRTALPGFWSLVILVTLAWRQNIRTGMDPNALRAGIQGLVFFSLLAAWAYWIERSTVSLPPRAPVLPRGLPAVD